jgi:hypothetical protein
MRVQPNANEPVGQEPRILTGRHAFASSSPGEQKLAGIFTNDFDVVVYRLPGWLGQLKTNRPSGLPLAHSGAIDGVAVGCNVIDLNGDNVTSSEFAIDREIEQRQVAPLPVDLKLRPDGPDVFRPERRLSACELPLFQGTRFAEMITFLLSFMGTTPLLQTRGACA